MSLTRARSLAVFAAFAFGYLLSSLVRGVTATLAPAFTNEFALTASQLGLLGGAYFLGFAVMQLPVGQWLDRAGPRAVLSICLAVAIASCVAFAMARGFGSLLLARFACGIGVSACLIAPLTGARLWLAGRFQQSANAWMLMAGSLGLLTATLPVQWALRIWGWRPVFLLLAALFALTLLAIAVLVPRRDSQEVRPLTRSMLSGYRPIFASRYFRAMGWIGLVNYGSLVALQTLWLGPWMTTVAGYTAEEAARGLFGVNLVMLFVFWFWGVASSRLDQAGLRAEQLMGWGLPLGIAALAGVAWFGEQAGWGALAVFCASSSFLALTHPAVGMAFPAHEAGRAISAFNLLLFLGVFVVQWGVGAGVDLLVSWHWSKSDAMRCAFAVLAVACSVSYLWFMAEVWRRMPGAAVAHG